MLRYFGTFFYSIRLYIFRKMFKKNLLAWILHWNFFFFFVIFYTLCIPVYLCFYLVTKLRKQLDLLYIAEFKSHEQLMIFLHLK
jgi:hypothetical protein